LKICRKALIVGVCCFVLLGCATTCNPPVLVGPVVAEKLVDGVYEGSYRCGPNSAKVNVTIHEQAIVAIDIGKHLAWKGKKAEPIIPQMVIEQQSTAVDAVSGATNSSKVIMTAIQIAVEQAYHAPVK